MRAFLQKLSVIAMALLALAANVQCVARCTGSDCDRPQSSSDLPPCHRHHTHAPEAKPCTSAQFVAIAQPHQDFQPAPSQAPPAILAPALSAPPASWQPASDPGSSPPPFSSIPTVQILRV